MIIGTRLIVGVIALVACTTMAGMAAKEKVVTETSAGAIVQNNDAIRYHFRDEQISELRKLILVAEHSFKNQDIEFLRLYVREGLFPKSNLDMGGSPLLYAGFIDKNGKGWKIEFDGWYFLSEDKTEIKETDIFSQRILALSSKSKGVFCEHGFVRKGGEKLRPPSQKFGVVSPVKDLAINEMSQAISNGGIVFIAYSQNKINKLYFE